MEYFCIILLRSPRIGRAQSLPKEEMLRQQLRSEDTQQQVGSCPTAMIQDGREFLPDADADCAQELRVTLIVHTGCSMERRSAKKPTTSANQALWDRWNILGIESILRPRMIQTPGVVVIKEQKTRDAD